MYFGKNFKLRETGITLVALVVTIIVLLILVGITLSLLLNNNGVLNRAQYASNTWANATSDEYEMMGQFDAYVHSLTSGFISREVDFSGIDFGEKTAETVTEGDTITIGTEQFMILKNDGIKIMAMPYYNISLDLENPVQTSVFDSTTKVKFANSNYWQAPELPMDEGKENKRNNVQAYIEAYSNKLNRINNKIVARIGKAGGDYGLNDYYAKSNSDSLKLLNPSGVGTYWMASPHDPNLNDWYSGIRNVESDGTMYRGDFASLHGIRPVVRIALSDDYDDSPESDYYEASLVFKNGSEIVSTPEVGNDVEIGKEKFKVIKITGNKVTALPYYNLRLNDTPIKQSSGAGKINFASAANWEYGANIDLDSCDNNIKQPIADYEAYLKSLGVSNIVAKIGRAYNTGSFEVDESEYIRNLDNLNVNGSYEFWLGSTVVGKNDVYYLRDGSFYSSGYSFSSSHRHGVRPLIIITLE